MVVLLVDISMRVDLVCWCILGNAVVNQSFIPSTLSLLSLWGFKLARISRTSPLGSQYLLPGKWSALQLISFSIIASAACCAWGYSSKVSNRRADTTFEQECILGEACGWWLVNPYITLAQRETLDSWAFLSVVGAVSSLLRTAWAPSSAHSCQELICQEPWTLQASSSPSTNDQTEVHQAWAVQVCHFVPASVALPFQACLMLWAFVSGL